VTIISKNIFFQTTIMIVIIQNYFNQIKHFVLKTQTLLKVSCVSRTTDMHKVHASREQRCHHPCYIASNERVISDEIEKDLEGSGCGLILRYSPHFTRKSLWGGGVLALVWCRGECVLVDGLKGCY
jgi:hypothetical protein